MDELKSVVITPEMRERVKRRFGAMADGITIRQVPTAGGIFKFDMSLWFRRSFTISDTGERLNGISQFHENVVESSMYELCDYVEKMVLSRKPDETVLLPVLEDFGIGVSINYNVPENLIIVSPKTYYELIYTLTSIQRCYK